MGAGDADILLVKLEALLARAIGFDPFGMILLDAGDHQAFTKAFVVEDGVGANLTGIDVHTAERTPVCAVRRCL